MTLVIGICIGMLIGKWLEGCRWRDNAKHPWRIESAGRLYKVTESE